MDQQSFFTIPSSVITGDDDSVLNSQTSPSLLQSRKSDSQSFKGLILTGRADEPPPQLIHAPRGPYILWTEETSDTFEAWFNNTPFTQAIQGQSEDKRKWFLPAWNTARRRATDSAWSHFHEAADIHKGIPKLLCKYCGTSQNHPGITQEGTSNMTRHLKSRNCVKSGKRPAEAQETLDRHFKKVYLIFFSSYLYCLPLTIISYG
jgi:hypothetical protein